MVYTCTMEFDAHIAIILTSTFHNGECSSVCNNIISITDLTNVLATFMGTNVTYLQDRLKEIETSTERRWTIDCVLKIEWLVLIIAGS